MKATDAVEMLWRGGAVEMLWRDGVVILLLPFSQGVEGGNSFEDIRNGSVDD